MKRSGIGLAALVLAFAVGQAQGAIISFFGEDFVGGDPSAPRPNSEAAQAAFLANLTQVGTEDFESFGDSEIPASLSFGGTTATFTGTGTAVRTVANQHRFPISGKAYLRSMQGGSFTIALDSPQRAIGFFGIDIGDFSGQLTLQLIDASSVTIDVPHTLPGPSGAVFYYGALGNSAADQFTAVTFSNTGASQDTFGFDDVSVGQVVPEPASVGVWSLLGVMACVAIRRRRRRT